MNEVRKKTIVFDLHGVLIRAAEMGKYYRLEEIDLLHNITGAPKNLIKRNQIQAFENWFKSFQMLKNVQKDQLIEKTDQLLERWLKDMVPREFLEGLQDLQELGKELEYKIPLLVGKKYGDEILVPRTREVLDELKAQSHLLYLASSANTRHIRGILEGTGIREYFTELFGFDNLGAMKLTKNFFRELFVSIGVLPSQSVVIGNSAQEIIFSKSLGAQSILIKLELASKKEDEELKRQALEVADFICETIAEVPQFFL